MRDRRAQWLFVLALAGDTVATAALLGALACVAGAIAQVFTGGAGLASVAGLLIAAMGCFALRAAVIAFADATAGRVSELVRTALRAEVLHEVARNGRATTLPATGVLATTLADRIEALDAYITDYLRASVMCVIGPTLVFIIIGVLDPLCLIVLAFTGPMLVFLLAVIGARTRKLADARAAELGWLHACFLDMVSGLATLKAFGRAHDGAQTIETMSRRHGHAAMEMLRTAFQTSLVMEWAATAATALVAVIVSFRLVSDRLSFAVALTALVLTPEFFLPFRRLAATYHAGADGKAALTAIDELIAPLPDAPSTQPVLSPVDLNLAVAPIRFESVTARYPDAPRDALKPVSFGIEPGETVALIGPTGIGKTTIVRLLLGLLPVQHGALTINGQSIASVPRAAWHDSIAWVSQHPVIVAGTIADNVRLGRPDAPDDALERALVAADAAAFIAGLPDGVETRLDEGGRNLSAGQRQRIALARAFLRDAPLVILDECTAHLDGDAEARVLAALGDHLRGRTALIVSHRDAAIALADRVIAVQPEEVMV